MPAHGQRIKGQQSTHQRRADTDYELERLSRLQRAEYAGQDTEHTGCGAIGRNSVGRARKQTAITGSLRRHIGHGLTFKAMNRCRDQWPAQQHADIVDQVACRQPIAPIDHQVVLFDNLAGVVGAQFELMCRHRDLRVQRQQAIACCACLAGADACGSK